MGIRLVAGLLVLTASFFGSIGGFFGLGNHDDDRDKKSFWERTFHRTIPLPDDVVLFGEDDLHINNESNILGGNAATNDRANLGRDVFIEGSLLADKVTLSEGVMIAGTLEASKISGKDYTLSGETIKPRKTKDYAMPDIQRPNPGRENIRIKKKEATTINPGRYDKITIDREAVVTVEPGTYEAERLTVDRDVTLIFIGPTEFRIGNHLSIGSDVMMDLRNDLETSAIKWHYRGDSSLMIGGDVFGAGEVIASRANIHVRDDTTWRGRLIGEEVKLGKGVVVSAGGAFASPPKKEDIVEDPDGGVYPINIVLVLMEEDTTDGDAMVVAEEIGGRITGVAPMAKLYQN